MLLLLLLLLFFINIPSLRATENIENRQDCFSCRIEVQQLNEPINLMGNWLFTRDDHPRNALPGIDLSNWVLIQTPGPWNKAYDDGQLFRVGWYRGKLHFHPSLIGQKVTLYVDAYMSRMKVFLDGELLYSREGKNQHESFHPIQAVPVVLNISQAEHTLSIRIDTPLMIGIYQMPFQLRPYTKSDPMMAILQLGTGELRYISGFLMLAAGFFFVLLYTHVRDKTYLIIGYICLGSYPFYALPHDLFMKHFNPDSLLILHYAGLIQMSLGYYCFSLCFYKGPRLITRFYIFSTALLCLSLIFLVIAPNIELFHIIRKLVFFLSMIMGLNTFVFFFQARRQNQSVLPLVNFLSGFYIATAFHDLLLALGFIQSVAIIYLGTLAGTAASIYMTIGVFRKHTLQMIIEEQKRKHAFRELSKLIFPHQIRQIEQGAFLEQTMPLGEARACVLCFDVVGSSKIQRKDTRNFLRNLFRQCNMKMLENYSEEPLKAKAFRIKEMGDGFLCSVGYPFASVTDNPFDDAYRLALQVFEIFSKELDNFSNNEPIYCGMGLAHDMIESFFPESGTKHYDLLGHGIVLATRYEAMRKVLYYELGPASYLIIQEKVFENLSPLLQEGLERYDLDANNHVIRNDRLATCLYFRRLDFQKNTSVGLAQDDDVI